jgi:hypothetical protein
MADPRTELELDLALLDKLRKRVRVVWVRDSDPVTLEETTRAFALLADMGVGTAELHATMNELDGVARAALGGLVARLGVAEKRRILSKL